MDSHSAHRRPFVLIEQRVQPATSAETRKPESPTIPVERTAPRSAQYLGRRHSLGLAALPDTTPRPTSKQMLPTSRITPQIGNSNDLDFLGPRMIEQGEWEPMNKAAAKAR